MRYCALFRSSFGSYAMSFGEVPGTVPVVHDIMTLNSLCLLGAFLMAESRQGYQSHASTQRSALVKYHRFLTRYKSYPLYLPPAPFMEMAEDNEKWRLGALEQMGSKHPPRVGESSGKMGEPQRLTGLWSQGVRCSSPYIPVNKPCDILTLASARAQAVQVADGF